MPRPHLSGASAFLVAAMAFLTIMAVAGAPSALLVVYQERWHFPDGSLTVAFAIYAFALLLALVTVGALSDRIGRRPVIIASLLLQALALSVFLLATDVTDVIAARAVQGAATGAATSAFSAYIIEVAPGARQRLAQVLVSIAAVGGLGVGAVFTGFAIRLFPRPELVVFGVALAIVMPMAALVALSPETVRDRGGIGRLSLPRVRVPVAARREFWTLAPGLLGIWMSAGLILSLGASLARQALGVDDGFLLGLLVAAQPLAATVATLVLVPMLRRAALFSAGLIGVLLGVTLELLSFGSGNALLLLCGAVITGVGFGCAFSRVLSTLVPLAGSHERAGLFAAVYVVGYLAYGVPASASGFLSDAIGLVPAAESFAVATLLMTAIGLATGRDRRRVRIRRATAE